MSADDDKATPPPLTHPGAGSHTGTGTHARAGTGKARADAPVAERLAALQADNTRLRDLLAVAGSLAEFGRFAAKQNHELRQPLLAIKGLAQLLLEQTRIDEEEARDFARHIVEQAERVTALVGTLREMSMPAQSSQRRQTDVPPALLRVTSLLGWRIRKGVTLRTEMAPDLPMVAIAPHQLEQILINLLSNALDAVAGRPSPLVQIRVGLLVREGGEPARVELRVADNGSGVARAVRGRLFESFFTTKGDEAGTGLGLAVSREIARASGGELELLDDVGTWAEPAVTVFRLTLLVAHEGLPP